MMGPDRTPPTFREDVYRRGMVQPQVIAEALGMELDDYVNARRAGKSVEAIAEERGIELETVVAEAMAFFRAALDEQTAAGRMTQAQADWMVAEHEAMLRQYFSATPPARDPGYRVGPGYGIGPGYGMGPENGMGPRYGAGPETGMGPGPRMGPGYGSGPRRGQGYGPRWDP
jgi:hypothetical protein